MSDTAVKLDSGKRKLSLIHPSTLCVLLTGNKDKKKEQIKEAIYYLAEAAHAKDNTEFIGYAYQALAFIVTYMESETAALRQLAIAMEYGIQKYGRNNWKQGMEWSRLIDAAQRHGLAILEDEEVDADSGNLHVAHMLASVHMLLGNHALGVGINDLY